MTKASNFCYLCFSRAIVRIPIAVRPMDIPLCSTRPSIRRRFSSFCEIVSAHTPASAISINAIVSCGLNSMSRPRSNSGLQVSRSRSHGLATG
jgi:hypothetical protein